MPSRSAVLAGRIQQFDDIFTSSTARPVPDIIEFCLSPEYANLAGLYPRQGTLLKIIFLQTELFTQYDLDVIAEWTAGGFTLDDTKVTDDSVLVYDGEWGIQPDILSRIEWLREHEYLWFQIVLLVLGRRSGKGFIGGICGAYVLWNFLCLANPHKFFGVDPNRRLAAQVFAGKKAQARDNQWRDIVSVISGAPCFEPFINSSLGESLTVLCPQDLLKAVVFTELRGMKTEMDTASFIVEPKEASPMAARGPASFMQYYDEGAHMVATGPSRSMKEVYDGASPSLDQFKKWAFTFSGSSPWAMIGQFYEMCQQALTVELETDETGEHPPIYRESLILQLESWAMYEDWEMTTHRALMAAPERLWIDRSKGKDSEGRWAHKNPEDKDLALHEQREGEWKPAIYYRELTGAIQEYDERMRRLERANPQMFAVERRSKWAVAQDAYLDQFHVRRMFHPWPEGNILEMQRSGPATTSYVMHGDPGKTSSNFGFCVAHKVPDPGGSPIPHVILDYVHGWRAVDFPNSYSLEGAADNEMDYEAIEAEINDLTDGFLPISVSFDQYASMGMIQRLSRHNKQNFKTAHVWERTATAPLNWQTAEMFKMALGMNRVHSPYYDLLQLECLFLRKLPGDKVDHPDSGPCTTKDVYDAVSACVHQLIGNEIAALYGEEFSALRIGTGMPGTETPDHMTPNPAAQTNRANPSNDNPFAAFYNGRRPTNRG